MLKIIVPIIRFKKAQHRVIRKERPALEIQNKITKLHANEPLIFGLLAVPGLSWVTVGNLWQWTILHFRSLALMKVKCLLIQGLFRFTLWTYGKSRGIISLAFLTSLSNIWTWCSLEVSPPSTNEA